MGCCKSVAFVLLICAAAANAQAGVLEHCQRKETQEKGIMSCVEAEHDRSANLLRDTNKELLDAINRKTRETGRKSLLKEFRAEQASHVRRRRAACSKAAAGTERLACEADSNFAHLDRLKRFAQ